MGFLVMRIIRHLRRTAFWLVLIAAGAAGAQSPYHARRCVLVRRPLQRHRLSGRPRRVDEPAHNHEALMLHLPDVTIVCIDNVAQDLARFALRDTLRLIKPAEVLFWTDGGGSEPERDWIGARELPFHERGREAADQPLWYEVPFAVKTSHFLTVQWDGWAINASAWDP